MNSGHVDALSRSPQIHFTFLHTLSLAPSAFVSNRWHPWDTGAIVPNSTEKWTPSGFYSVLGSPLPMINCSEESEH